MRHLKTGSSFDTRFPGAYSFARRRTGSEIGWTGLARELPAHEPECSGGV